MALEHVEIGQEVVFNSSVSHNPWNGKQAVVTKVFPSAENQACRIKFVDGNETWAGLDELSLSS